MNPGEVIDFAPVGERDFDDSTTWRGARPDEQSTVRFASRSGPVGPVEVNRISFRAGAAAHKAAAHALAHW
ncbi:hypothetical protein EOS_40030 [Caballeronia mineralivorans PML1(12)]|uniref:Uncharacterized protein n=1 Tax=Caballeronia mineralivorans PML1(12) TaxID=908627 RepID=A0A0J1CJE5_9BURK|nr:hypothetical protein EOS_40030 [Caballeronia mineralivorans PML1(12)]